MPALKINIVRFISADQPGFVECTFYDARNTEFTVREKVPVVTLENLDENSIFPRPGVIACMILNRWTDESGRSIVTIDTEQPWGVNTIDGKTRFDVLPEQLTTLV